MHVFISMKIRSHINILLNPTKEYKKFLILFFFSLYPIDAASLRPLEANAFTNIMDNNKKTSKYQKCY